MVEILGILLVVAPPEPLNVVAAGSAPFVFEKEGRIQGLSLDLWEKVAVEAGVVFEVERAPNVQAAMDAVHSGRADVAVGPISITAARTASVSFTQPYFRSRTGILTLSKKPSVVAQLKSYVSGAFFYAVGVLMLLLLLVGAAIWAIERRANPEQFPESAGRGIGAGMWLALVTMTTVGYGDKAPVTPAGKVFVGIWMVISMITASSLTASIATALTLANLEQAEVTGLRSLDQKAVAVMDGTTAVDVARSVGARLMTVPDLKTSIDKVLNDEALATVSDLPILQYQSSQHPEWPVVVIPSEEHVETYGFAVPHGSELLVDVNVALLELVESGEVDAIKTRWLGN